MSGLEIKWLEQIQRISNETMTRVIWIETEKVDTVERKLMLLVEPFEPLAGEPTNE